jgi:internalin A
MRPREPISGFIKRIGRTDHVIVVLSDKYLRSTYCMTELYGIYQRLAGQKQDFLGRVIPRTLQDARIGTWRDRVEHAWQAEFQAMEQSYQHLGGQDFKPYKAMQDWHNRVGDMRTYVNDVLQPRTGLKPL